jgi:hypothetical protein
MTAHSADYVAPTLSQELESLLNRHSQENGSNTPDVVLAQYLLDCLGIFNRAVNRREDWYGRTADLPLIDGSIEPPGHTIEARSDGTGCAP